MNETILDKVQAGGEVDCEYPFDRKTEKDSYLAFVEMPDSCFGFYKILFEKMFVGLVYIDFFRVRKSFIACHPIFVIFFRLMELVPACLGLKVIGMKVTFSL